GRRPALWRPAAAGDRARHVHRAASALPRRAGGGAQPARIGRPQRLAPVHPRRARHVGALDRARHGRGDGDLRPYRRARLRREDLRWRRRFRAHRRQRHRRLSRRRGRGHRGGAGSRLAGGRGAGRGGSRGGGHRRARGRSGRGARGGRCAKPSRRAAGGDRRPARRRAGRPDPHQGHRPGQRRQAQPPRHLAFRPDRGVDGRGDRMGRLLSRLPRTDRARGLGGAGEVDGRVSGGRRQMSNASQSPLLSVRGVETYYGKIVALRGVDMDVNRGEVVTLIGANGAGKSTLMMTICGAPRARAGSIVYDGTDITRMPTHDIMKLGIAQSPEGRRIFPRMTVMENLQMGALLVPPQHFDDDLKRVFELFPRLKERAGQRGGTLSGGEQQMLAIARARMSRPKLLLLDEPSLGLAPLIVKQIFEVIKELNRSEGLTVFLVEQNAFHALKLAHRGYVMVNGNITMSGTGAELLKREEVRAAYLEGGRH